MSPLDLSAAAITPAADLGLDAGVTSGPASVTTATPMSEEAPAPEYTIDELAAETRVPSRTIRFYQSKGLLGSPNIRGRVAYYGKTHIDRLALIAQLQDRGLRIEAIRELVKRIDEGDVDVGDWLGLEAQLKAPWANDRPRTVSEAELLELAGTSRPGLIGDLVRSKLAKREGDVFFVPSPGLLRIAARLEAAGLDFTVTADAETLLRRHMARAAEELTQFFFKQATEASQGGEAFVANFEELRPVGLEAVRLVFGQEVERVLRELIDSGKTTRLPTKKKSGR